MRSGWSNKNYYDLIFKIDFFYHIFIHLNLSIASAIAMFKWI